jgi:hypothetical protein
MPGLKYSLRCFLRENCLVMEKEWQAWNTRLAKSGKEQQIKVAAASKQHGGSSAAPNPPPPCAHAAGSRLLRSARPADAVACGQP